MSIYLRLKSFLLQKRVVIILLLLLVAHIFLRFYQIEERNTFAWDQVDNAWAAKQIVIDHKFPLLGMVAKQNSGFSIGPGYYYLLASFYWIFHMDPIASGVFAGVTSIFTFFVIYFVTKKLFSIPVALIAVFLHTFSIYILNFDRVQWPVNFIAPLSYLAFYFLYKVIKGNGKYMLALAVTVGFFFHIHFTAVFFPIIIFCCLPFFPKTKKTIAYAFASILVFLLFLSPNIIANLQSHNSQASSMNNYIQTYYHGFHLQRVLQLTKDAFIEFEGIMTIKLLKPLEPLLVIAFIVLYYKQNRLHKKTWIVPYLVVLWIVIPWFAFATYSGEITNYYFSMGRPIALLVLSYLLLALWQLRFIWLRVGMIVFAAGYLVINMIPFFTANKEGLAKHRQRVKAIIKIDGYVSFSQGNPDSYLYYIYRQMPK